MNNIISNRCQIVSNFLIVPLLFLSIETPTNLRKVKINHPPLTILDVVSRVTNRKSIFHSWRVEGGEREVRRQGELSLVTWRVLSRLAWREPINYPPDSFIPEYHPWTINRVATTSSVSSSPPLPTPTSDCPKTARGKKREVRIEFSSFSKRNIRNRIENVRICPHRRRMGIIRKSWFGKVGFSR